VLVPRLLSLCFRPLVSLTFLEFLAELESRETSKNQSTSNPSTQHIEKIPDTTIEQSKLPIHNSAELHTTDDFDISYDQQNFNQDVSNSNPFLFEAHKSDESSYPFDVTSLQHEISNSSFNERSPSSGELVNQGLEEPLPHKEVQDEL
jgi:hypothetical protein